MNNRARPSIPQGERLWVQSVKLFLRKPFGKNLSKVTPIGCQYLDDQNTQSRSFHCGVSEPIEGYASPFVFLEGFRYHFMAIVL